MKKFGFYLLLGLLALTGSPSIMLGQQTGYKQTNLVAKLPGVAAHTDTQLSNPWGISVLPNQPFWIANNNGGTSTLYDAQGNKQQLVVGIPGAKVNPCNPGCPTGTVANSTGQFGGGSFLFDTEDGIVASWTGANNAVVAFDDSANGAVYKGLALLTNDTGNFLLLANFRSGKVDVLDHNFNPTNLAGSFTDPHLPAGMAPHGIHILSQKIYVAYAMQDGAKHDPTISAGSGVVDIFDLNGNFVETFASGGKLNAPWGVVETPATFGTFSNAILVGNFGDGTINAYDPASKKFLGQLMDTANNVLINAGLWDMIFGQNGTGDPSILYFTAGGSDQTHGLFATLVPGAAATTGDFSLALSAQSATLPVGGSATLAVNASSVGGFNAPISLSCSGLPAGLSCSFSPSSITPGTSSVKSTLKVAAASTYVPPTNPGPYSVPGTMMGWLPLSGLGLAGMVFADRKKQLSAKRRKQILWFAALTLLALGTLVTVGCGGGSSKTTNTANTVTMMVTGTSGAIAHSTPVTLTVQ